MDSSLLGLMELFIVLAFVLGWGVLELVTLRMDKRRQREAESAKTTEEASQPPATL